MKLCLAQFDSGKGQQIIDQPVQTLGVFMNGQKKFLRFCPVIDGSLLERFHKSDNGRQRRLNFMGHIGHKISPDLLELFQARHIVKDDHGFGVLPGQTLNGGDIHIEDHGVFIAQSDFL